MFVLYVDKSIIHKEAEAPVVSGAAGVYAVHFDFSQDWEGLSRTAIFNGTQKVQVPLDSSGDCMVPTECLAVDGWMLRVGVYGTDGNGRVLPTLWADLGKIERGVTSFGQMPKPPAPSVYAKIMEMLDKKQTVVKGVQGQVAGFDESGSMCPVSLRYVTRYQEDPEPHTIPQEDATDAGEWARLPLALDMSVEIMELLRRSVSVMTRLVVSLEHQETGLIEEVPLSIQWTVYKTENSVFLYPVARYWTGNVAAMKSAGLPVGRDDVPAVSMSPVPILDEDAGTLSISADFLPSRDAEAGDVFRLHEITHYFTIL